MRFAFTDDQLLFADGLRDLLAKEFPAADLRTMWEDGGHHAPELWRHLAEMGVLGALAPESAGGMGMGMVDAILLFEQLGYAAVPGPVIESMAVVVPALADDPAGASLAADVAGGALVATAAIEGSPYVAHAAVSGAVLTPEGLVTGFDVTDVHGIDAGRSLGSISGGSVQPVTFAVDDAFDRGALATAAYLVGASQRMIDIAADYARQREQFGKPIGSFQAVKHLLADALLKVEFARPAVYAAAWELTTRHHNARRSVSMAKTFASDAAYRTTRSTMQVHGGIGYTWEADLQLWMKKAWALQRSYGDATFHRRRAAAAILG
jgi:alkylation response protein AidB-like acyl-CoA dehydrogenase